MNKSQRICSDCKRDMSFSFLVGGTVHSLGCAPSDPHHRATQSAVQWTVASDTEVSQLKRIAAAEKAKCKAERKLAKAIEKLKTIKVKLAKALEQVPESPVSEA